jgi:hypothetical protein
LRAVEQELAWLTGDQHRRHAIRLIEGRTRRCASQEGNALAVCCRLGMAGDPRVRVLTHSLGIGNGRMGVGTATRIRPRITPPSTKA